MYIKYIEKMKILIPICFSKANNNYVLVFFLVAFMIIAPFRFCTRVGGIKVLGTPLRSFSFTSYFFKDALNDDV